MPIVALTAHDADNYRAKCLAADMDDILSKPYTLEDCTRLLRRWLARADEKPRRGAGAAASGDRTLRSGAARALGFRSVDATPSRRLRKMRAGKHADLYAKLVDLFRAGSAESLAKLREALDSA